MAKEKTECCSSKNYNSNAGAASGGAVYGFGLFGALFFYLSTASGVTEILLGILKAFVWPGMMVYHLFKFLGM